MKNEDKIDNKTIKILLLNFLLIILTSVSSLAIVDLMGFEANAVDSSGDPIQSANLFIEVWDSSTGGILVYNSTDDYLNNVSSGKIDVTLGDATQNLTLEYGKDYYMEIYINNDELDFNDNERLRFQSSVGNITSSRISPNNITSSLLEENISISNNLSTDILEVFKTAIFNDQAGDNDFVIRGDTDNNLFFIDSSIDAIGIGTNTPSSTEKLNIIGDLNVTGVIYGGGSLVNTSSNISGGGTIDRLVKFVDATAIGNSIITEANDARIGIDIDNPAALLEVRRSAGGLFELNISGLLYVNSTLGAVSINSESPQGLLHIENSSSLSIPWLNISDATNPIFIIESNKNIGINTINPTHTLTIQGDLNVTGDSFLNNLNISGITFSEGKLNAQVDDTANESTTEIITLVHTTPDSSNGTNNIGSSLIFAAEDALQQIENLTEIRGILTDATSGGEDSALTFLTRTSGGSLTERLRINDQGFIGINTTSPGAELEVIGNVNFSNGTTQQFYFDSSLGFIGIGTSSPTQALNIIGDLNVTGTSYLGSFTIQNELIIGNNNFSGTDVGIGTLTPSALLDIAGTGLIDLNVSGNLYVNSTNVGIGTNEPNQTLTVVGNVEVTSDLSASNLSLGGASIYWNGSNLIIEG